MLCVYTLAMNNVATLTLTHVKKKQKLWIRLHNRQRTYLTISIPYATQPSRSGHQRQRGRKNLDEGKLTGITRNYGH